MRSIPNTDFWLPFPMHGASELAGYPVDTNGLAGTPSPSAIFTGTRTMFQQAGFTEIGRTYRTRPVMRLKLQHR